jgi:hypothetical protein
MSLTAEQSQLAESALDDIEMERQRARGKVYSSWDMSGGSSKPAAISYLEKTAVQAMDSLRAQLNRVDAGEISWSTWVSNAESVRRGIQDVAGYSDEWSLSGVLYDAAAATGKDVGTGAGKVYAAASSGTAWGVGTFVLFGLGYLWFTRRRG